MANDPKPHSSLDLTIDDSDDDIVDLLEVVKPGKGGQSVEDPVPAQSADFGADLDSMLEQLASAEKALDEAEEAESGVVFPDPTPSDHPIDPDERLDLPGMDDLDGLMRKIGADQADGSARPGQSDGLIPEEMEDLDSMPVMGEPQPRHEAGASMDQELDALLSESQADTPDEQGLDDLLRSAGPLETESAKPAAELPDLDDFLPEEGQDDPAPAASAPASANGSGPSAEADSYGEVDLNELDALLDDMLATAPPSGPASTETGERPESIPAAMQEEGSMTVIQAHIDTLYTQVAGLNREMGGITTPVRTELPQLRQGLAKLESSLESLREGLPGNAGDGPGPGQIASMIDTLQARVEEQDQRIESLMRELDDMRTNLEKMAAEAAAKVIREELAALLKQ